MVHFTRPVRSRLLAATAVTMTIAAPLVSTGHSTVLTTTRSCLRALLRRPSLLVLMVLYVFAAACATSTPGLPSVSIPAASPDATV